jgi:predicted enzyme related to lactoylglutathione lyase
MNDVSLIVYPVADLEAAKDFFGELVRSDPYADSAYYVGYKSGATEIGLVPAASAKQPGALVYWNTDDIAASVKSLLAKGGTVMQDVTDVGYGMLVATVKEPSGSTIGLRQLPKG